MSPHTLFTNDTLRCDSITRMLHFTSAGCFPPDIASIEIVGRDSTSFLAGIVAGDSLSITVAPRRPRDLQAALVIHKSDGTADSVVLQGFNLGAGALSAPQSLFVSDTVHCDSLIQWSPLTRTGCTPPSVSAVEFIGRDSLAFSAVKTLEDSLLVMFNPMHGGWSQAHMVLTVTDGSSDTIKLGGIFNDVGHTTIAHDTLFAHDTAHCDSVIEWVHVSYFGCGPPQVSSWNIAGRDSASFQVQSINRDSISIAYSAANFGSHSAMLIGTLSDGSNDTIVLAGERAALPFSYSLSTTSAFSTDSLYECDNSKSRTVIVVSNGCPWPNVVSQTITGAASSDYSISRPMASRTSDADSVIISFLPSAWGTRDAAFDATLDDGSHIVIPLHGYGIAPSQLTLATSDQSPRALGGTADVPISIEGLTRAEDVELVLHYDTHLPYLGSFSPSNAALDVAGEQWRGRSKLRIMQAVPAQVVGYARFEIYNDSLLTPTVSFDSLNVLTEITPCAYLPASVAIATVNLPNACGMTYLSHYLHYGTTPAFSISPNPASGEVKLSSSVDVGEASVAIYDMIGIERCRTSIMLVHDAPVSIALPEASGMYYLRVKSVAGVSSMSVVVSR